MKQWMRQAFLFIIFFLSPTFYVFGGLEINGLDVSTVSGGGGETAWTCQDGTNLVLSGSGPYVLRGTETNNVSVRTAADCSVVVSNVILDLSMTGDETSGLSGVPAFDCDAHTVKFVLFGTNVFLGGCSCAGLGVSSNESGTASLTITNQDASAVLVARGGWHAAGIGGGNGMAGGTVIVLGGALTVSGGKNGAGVGGGAGHGGGTVFVLGGVLEAAGGKGGAGIGGGTAGDGACMTVSGGRISATGGLYAAGIGGGDGAEGSGGNGGNLSVSGGTVVARKGESDEGETGAQYDVGPGDGDAKGCGMNIFTGGSICLANGLIASAASNGSLRVSCVAIDGLPANAAIDLSGLSDYGVNDIFADAAGEVDLWLPGGASGAVTDCVFAVSFDNGAGGVTNLLKACSVDSSGTRTSSTNATLSIRTYDAQTGAITWSPAGLAASALVTVCSTNLVDWTEARPSGASTLFLKLRVKE